MKHLADYAARLGQCQRHYRTDQLTGPHNARHRADLLSILAGERVPASRAGINALESAAFTAFGVTDDDGQRACLAVRRDRLKTAIIAALPPMHETAAEPHGMPADNAAERHHHEEHCKQRVSTWTMRDVLDFLGEHYIDQADYTSCEDQEDMIRVDRENRLRAARWLAGLPVPMIGTPEERAARTTLTYTPA